MRNGQSTDLVNIGHKTQSKDEHNKKNKTKQTKNKAKQKQKQKQQQKHEKLKRCATWKPQTKTPLFNPCAHEGEAVVASYQTPNALPNIGGNRYCRLRNC